MYPAPPDTNTGFSQYYYQAITYHLPKTNVNSLINIQEAIAMPYKK